MRNVFLNLVIGFSLAFANKSLTATESQTKTIAPFKLPLSHKSRKQHCHDREYDIIIVGMGTAGSVLANRLSEDPHLNVLVIEAGRDDSRLSPLLPIDLPEPLPNKVNNPWPVYGRLGPVATYSTQHYMGFESWQFTPLLRDDPTSRYIWYSRGSTWGGCTVHNAGIAVRGAPQIYDQWAALGNSLWSYNEVLPYFKKSENRSQRKAPFDASGGGTLYFSPEVPFGELGNFDPSIHGDSGPVPVVYFDAEDPFSDALFEAVQLPNIYPGAPNGFPINRDPDNPINDQWLTNINETAIDQYGSDFDRFNPYSGGPVVFPSNFAVLGLEGVAPRLQRASAQTGYIYPIQNRKNLTIISEALVKRVLFDKNRKAVGVEYIEGWNIYQTGRQMNTVRGGIGGTPTDAAANAEEAIETGKIRRVKASKEIILCGGVFNSPQILLLSGIGPKEDLNQLKIKTVKNLPGVGKHLVDHPEFDVCWQHDALFDILSVLGSGQLPKSGLISLNFRSTADQPFADFLAHIYNGGILTGESALADLTDALGNARYDGPPQYITPNAQRYDPPLAIAHHAALLLEHRANVKSEGFVKLKSKDPTVPPHIVNNFLLDPADMQSTIRAFRDTIAPLVQNLPNGFFTQWLAPLPQDFLTSGTLLLPDKSNFNETAFAKWVLSRVWGHHASGTCKMGPSTDRLAVVDQRGRVHGVRHLRVCDCSIFPVIPTANTATPAYMVGERMADLIKEDLCLR